MQNERSMNEISVQNYLEGMYSIIPGNFYWKNKNGYYLGCSESTLKVFGFKSLHEIIGKNDYDLWPEQAEKLQKNDDKVINTGNSICIEEMVTFKSQRIYYICIKMPLLDDKNSIIGVVGNFIPITDIKNNQLVLETEKEKAQQEARKTIQYLQSIVSSVPGSVYWKNREGIYLGCNEFMVKTAGLKSKQDIIGKTDAQLWPSQAASLIENDKFVMQTGNVLKIEEEVVLPNGEKRFFAVAKMPLFDADNNIVGIIGNSLDITEQKMVQNALAEQIKKTEQANRSSGKFIAQAAHEIRNPISGAITFLDEINENYENIYSAFKKSIFPLLRKSDLAELAIEIDNSFNELKLCHEYASGAAQNADKALRNLEKLHLVQLNGVKTNLELNSISNLINEAIQYSSNLKNNQTRCKLDIKKEVPKEILIDYNNLRDALSIVIGNAIRFSSPCERIQIIVEAKKSLKSNSIDFIISDHGAGIAQEQINELFKHSNTDEISVDEILKKPSVQLMRVKLIVEASGGNLTINSKMDAGTTVTISIPYEETIASLQSFVGKENIVSNEYKFNECKILVVEDDLFIQ